PDALIKTLPAADLLLVDEAAALPQMILKKLLESYSRIVFASTMHGYEGSGLGFKYQFAKQLDRQTPGWQAISLAEPVRWAKVDPLEQFSYQALLLNAELNAYSGKIATAGQQQLTTLTAAQLAEDESLLQEVFALLVTAHYRTRPSDLQVLLDDNNKIIWLLRDQKQLVAVCWLNQEGSLEPALAIAVHQGRRRLPGELLPQSLLTHAGDLQAASLNYQRIIRIAVRPACQQLGLGSLLLEKLAQQLPRQTDLLGCSFAVQPALLKFWLSNGFVPVRLGLHEDTVSGGRAVVMLKACSDKGSVQITALQRRLAEQWPVLLSRDYADVPAELVMAISCSLPIISPVLTRDDRLDIDSYIDGQRALEFSFVPLQKWLWQQLKAGTLVNCAVAQQAMLIQVFIQQQPLSDICRRHQLSGHKALLTELRKALRQLAN
ncbi:MAG: GNAT family N-acetyltransferase, partial [Methylophaga sp.]|nr:GNAT family N-acetyltransferase [Methylophaga sp.]